MLAFHTYLEELGPLHCSFLLKDGKYVVDGNKEDLILRLIEISNNVLKIFFPQTFRINHFVLFIITME